MSPSLYTHLSPPFRIVMYIPTATSLTSGGFFVRRPDTGKVDTILSAQAALRAMVQAHGKQLSALPRTAASASASSSAPPGGAAASGGTLLDLVNAGLASDNNVSAALAACVACMHTGCRTLPLYLSPAGKLGCRLLVVTQVRADCGIGGFLLFLLHPGQSVVRHRRLQCPALAHRLRQDRRQWPEGAPGGG